MGTSSFEEQVLDKVVFQQQETVERLPLGDGPIAEDDDTLPVWLGVVAELQSIGLDVVEASTVLRQARHDHMVASIGLITAEHALQDARYRLICESQEYQAGKNAETREAILARLTNAEVAAVRQASAKVAQTRLALDLALDDARMVQTLVEALGK